MGNITGCRVRRVTAGCLSLFLVQMCGCSHTPDVRSVDKPFGSPLVLDLDGDGIEILDAWRGSVEFDFEGDRFREKTAWVKGEDGLLAQDLNRNGKIDDASELFGENPTDFEEIVLESGGFARLARLDSNGDGFITPVDRRYRGLLVWRDLNADGRTDPGELRSLSDEGIRSITLQFSRVNGNLGDAYVTARSRFAREDGSSGEISEVWFRTEPSVAAPPKEIRVGPKIKSMPYIGGSGLVYDLHSAMQRDRKLRAMVEELVRMPPENLDEYDWRVEAIFLRWTGADKVRSDSRGPWVDARRLVALERWEGNRFYQAFRGFRRDPLQYAGAAMMRNYRETLSETGLKLFAQIQAGDVLWPEYDYAMDAFHVLSPDYSARDFVSRAAQHSPRDPRRRVLYWRTIVRLADSLGEAGSSYKPESDTVSVDGESFVRALDASLSRSDPGLSYASLRRLNSELQTAFPAKI